MALRKKLSMLYGCTSISGNIMQTNEFKECFTAIDSRITIPDQKTIQKDFKETLATSRANIKTMLKGVKRMTIASDIWTKKGNRSSYLGVTATFFYPPLKRKVNVILGVQKFSSITHKAEDIIREMRKVMATFEISPNQVWRSITDGASNMVCSHRVDQQTFCQLENPEDKAVQTDRKEENPGISSEDDEVDTIESTNIGVTLGEDIDIGRMNPTYRRLTCFIHTTLICLKKFELDKVLQGTIDRVKNLVSKFSRSAKLTGDLVKQSGVGLVSFCEVRWNYVYLVLHRLLRVETIINSILLEQGKSKYLLLNEDWERIREIADFLKPFHDYTNMVSTEKEAVSSEVVVAILSMYYHLDKYDNSVVFRDVASNIKQALKKKFSKWFHDTQPDFDGTYIIATLLDPRYRMILPPTQQISAKKHLLKEFKTWNSDQIESNAVEEQQSQHSHALTTSKFPLIQEMKEAFLKMQASVGTPSESAFELELEKYLSNTSYDNASETSDAFEFWSSKTSEYPLLAPVALDYLSIPDSTANVERTFGTASAFTKGLSNRLDGINLENKVFLQKNKKLCKELCNLWD